MRRDDPPLDKSLTSQNYTDTHIDGLRVESAEKEPSYGENGIPQIRAGTKAIIRLFGTGITPDTLISFTDVKAERGSVCDKIKSNEFPVSIHEVEFDGRGEKLQEIWIIFIFRWKM